MQVFTIDTEIPKTWYAISDSTLDTQRYIDRLNDFMQGEDWVSMEDFLGLTNAN